MIPADKAVKIVGGAFVAVVFVAAVWFVYAAEAETAPGNAIDVRVLYGSLVFTLFFASALFLARFVVFQWAKDGPTRRRVTSVLLLYVSLFVLLFLLFLPFDPFDAGLLMSIAVALGFGVGLGVFVVVVFSVFRAIDRWLRRSRTPNQQPWTEERPSQLAEAKDQSGSRAHNEDAERPSRHLWRDIKSVLLALGYQEHRTDTR